MMEAKLRQWNNDQLTVYRIAEIELVHLKTVFNWPRKGYTTRPPRNEGRTHLWDGKLMTRKQIERQEHVSPTTVNLWIRMGLTSAQKTKTYFWRGEMRTYKQIAYLEGVVIDTARKWVKAGYTESPLLIYHEFDGERLTIAEIAKRNFVSYSAAHKWIRRGLKTRPTYKRSK